jgi:two-component system, NtrC family, sensor kinase
MNILVTDDEGIVIESLQRGLRKHGYSVVGALNGEEALKKLNNGGPKIDLVITDYAMPGMNGLELVRKIRRAFSTMPIIMMTAYGDKHLVIEALRNHCDSFIEKPFSLDNLLDEVRNVETHFRQSIEQSEQPELFSKFVHQINNPLTCITGSAELALKKLDNVQDIKGQLRSIITAAERIENINHKITRLGKGREEITKEVDLKGLLEKCLGEFEGLLLLKSIFLIKEMTNEPLMVWGVPFDFEQTFKNLILNAVQAMEESTKKQLTIRVEKDQSGAGVIIEIEDSGCGIPENQQTKIFQPYYSTKSTGSGLGLAIAKSYVEKAQGTISVNSEEGHGSTFIIRLQAGEKGPFPDGNQVDSGKSVRNR